MNEIMTAVQQQSRNDLLSFCVYNDKFFEVNKHHILISDKLQAFMRWDIKRLMLQLPPRSGKSRMVCEAIAHWMWLLQGTDIIYTWHSISLLEWFSRQIRERVDSTAYKTLFDNRIKDNNSAIHNWSDTHNNRLMIYWVRWGITWVWGHRIIIDDPYATREDAESDTIRKKVWEWYISTLLSRRHNENAWICVIMQRWREDDLVWQLLEQWWDEWDIVQIPAIEEWESFWASRFSVEELKNIEKNMWAYFFASQYQQDPINEWGWDFKKEYFNYYDSIELSQVKQYLDIVTFVDLAISEKQESDNTAIVTIWLDKRSNNIYVLEIDAGKYLPDMTINKIFETYLKWKPRRIWIEDVQFQRMLIQEVKKQMRIRNIFFVLDSIRPQWEKVARIRSTLQPRYSNKAILHNNEMYELESELLKFPNAKHDDRADALAWAVNMLNTVIINQWSTLVTADYWLDYFLN